ncbi:unnamed protein product, partial [Trichobilharzia regenti]
MDSNVRKNKHTVNSSHQIMCNLYDNLSMPVQLCNSFRGTSPTDRLEAATQTRLCFTRLQKVHKKANCEELTKFSGRLNVKSRSDSYPCDGIDEVRKPLVAAGKPSSNGVSQTTPRFVQEKRVTVSDSSSDSTSFQGITGQSKSIKPSRICEEEPEFSTAVIKDFESDEVDQMDDGKVNICDNDGDSALLSLVDHDEMRGMPTNAELNKGSVQLEREVELRADVVVE